MTRGLIFYRFRNKNTSEAKESFIKNIRGNRLIFDTHEAIDPGIDLECEIYQRTKPKKNIIMPVSVLAKVIWVKRINNCGESGNDRYRAGLKICKRLDKISNLV